MRLNPRDRLILALDVSSVDAARSAVERLGDSVGIFKIGYQQRGSDRWRQQAATLSVGLLDLPTGQHNCVHH